MRVLNFEYYQATIQTKNLRFKFIMNEDAVLFFPEAEQHRSKKAGGISYEDDYKGNSVAGIITGDHVEIRFHSSFSDDRVRNLWSLLKAQLGSPSAHLSHLPVFYQGRPII